MKCILIGIGIVVIIVYIFVLYCCIVVGAKSDRQSVKQGQKSEKEKN